MTTDLQEHPKKLQDIIALERQERIRERIEDAMDKLPDPPRLPSLISQMRVLDRPDMLRLQNHLYKLKLKGEDLITAPFNRAMRRAVKSLLKPIPKMTVVEFLENEISGWDMSDGPIPGKVKVKNQEIARNIILTLNEPGVSSVAVCMSPQMCKTFVLQCIYAYACGVLNTTVMIVMPNDNELKPFVYGKLNKMIADFPALRKIVNPKKNGLYFKQWLGGFGIQTNAGSDTNLGGKTIQIVLTDEVDKMVITKSGDPVDLAFKRTLAYKDSGFNYQSCTPTHEKGRIWQAYLGGDRRRFFIKCPNKECGHEQVPIWAENPRPDLPMSELFVRWVEDGTEMPIPGTCKYHCQKCDHAFSEAERQRALRNGIHRQTKAFTCCGSYQDPMSEYHSRDVNEVWDHNHWEGVGYALCKHSKDENGLLNPKCKSVIQPAVENLPGSAVTNSISTFHGWHVQAQTIKMDQLAIDYKKSSWRSFMNNNLGLPFLDSEIFGLEAESMSDRLETFYSASCLNDRSVLLTAGIDVQQGYLALVILAWGPGKECWLVHYEEIGRDLPWGDTMREAVWAQLDERMGRTWYTKSGRKMVIDAACIDTGGGHGRTERAKAWAWRRQERMLREAKMRGKGAAPQFVLAINGARGEDGLNFKDPFPAKAKFEKTTYGVGTLALKAEILEMLANSRVGPGYAHFTADAIKANANRDGTWHISEFFRMLTSEHKEIDEKTGKTIWVQDRDRNEVFDCYNYALSALYAIGVFVKGFSLEGRARAMKIPIIISMDERQATEMSIRARVATQEVVTQMDVPRRSVVKRQQRQVRRMPVIIKPGTRRRR